MKANGPDALRLSSLPWAKGHHTIDIPMDQLTTLGEETEVL